MQTFSAKDSVSKLSLMVLAAFGFVILGMWIAGILGEPPKPGREWLGWICTAFFGLMGGIGLGRLWNPSEQVRISGDGIYYSQWSDDTIPWSAITDITIWEYKWQRCIMLHLANPEQFRSTTLLGKMAVANRAVTSGDIAIPLAGTDRTVDEAMAAINNHKPSLAD